MEGAELGMEKLLLQGRGRASTLSSLPWGLGACYLLSLLESSPLYIHTVDRDRTSRDVGALGSMERCHAPRKPTQILWTQNGVPPRRLPVFASRQSLEVQCSNLDSSKPIIICIVKTWFQGWEGNLEGQVLRAQPDGRADSCKEYSEFHMSYGHEQNNHLRPPNSLCFYCYCLTILFQH